MTRVKICGITELADARRAVDLGAWALGMIFWPGSARVCPIDEAARIGAQLRRKVELVGVFVNAPLDEIARTADVAELSVLQLHGDEGPSFCAEAARRTGCRVMKAVRVRTGADVNALRAFKTDFHLLDAHVEGARGGTGETFNWDLARRHEGSAGLVLSGGLDPENVDEAVRTVRPFAVDTASGTESAPGRKDAAKLTAFFRTVEAADRALAPV